jgi:hypothetical protein
MAPSEASAGSGRVGHVVSDPSRSCDQQATLEQQQGTLGFNATLA